MSLLRKGKSEREEDDDDEEEESKSRTRDTRHAKAKLILDTRDTSKNILKGKNRDAVYVSFELRLVTGLVVCVCVLDTATLLCIYLAICLLCACSVCVLILLSVTRSPFFLSVIPKCTHTRTQATRDPRTMSACFFPSPGEIDATSLRTFDQLPSLTSSCFRCGFFPLSLLTEPVRCDHGHHRCNGDTSHSTCITFTFSLALDT